MEHGATAPALPAAKRTVLRPFWQVCILGLSLNLLSATSSAEDTPRLSSDRTDTTVFSENSIETASSTAPHAVPGQVKTATRIALSETRSDLIGKPRSKPERTNPKLARSASADQRSALSPTRLFGSRGKPVSISPVSQRWQRALSELESAAQGTDQTRHGFRAYSAILEQVRPLRRGLQIPKVNYMVNRLLAYREDSFLYKKGEYWASPVETLSRRAGDCEDYAILKYTLLRDLGIKDEDMRIVVLRDTAARQYHAVLSVRHNGKWLILDNRFSRVRFERDLPHYQALYSVNAAGEWSHTPNKGKPVNLAARLKSATR
ncbi:transglutaminase-like cysteine peptidase [Roseibium sp. HPY-6]|uniref:transglutaminase-like cysteine peptidase n=1 Tax=Roseibium sp. HPY-6 TaxID=3229852 RepID=UPI00338DC68B